MTEKLSDKVVKNVLATIVWQTVSIVVGFLLTPLLINKLGLEKYGLWALMSGIIAYINLLDLGAGSGISRFVAESMAKNDWRKASKIISAGIIIYINFSIILLLFYFFRKEVLGIFKISYSLFNEAVFVMTIFLFVAGMINIMLVFRSFLIGIQEMVVSHFFATVGAVLFYVISVVVLKVGGSLREITIAYLVFNIVWSIVFIFFIGMKYKELKLFYEYPEKSLFKELFSFGIKVNFTRMCQIINSNLGKVLLGSIVAVSSISYFDIGLKVASFLKMIPYVLLYPISMVAAQLNVLERKSSLFQVYKKSNKYIFVLGMPIGVFFIFYAEPLIIFWLGNTEFKEAVLILQIICIGFVIDFFSLAGGSVAYGCGLPEIETKKSVITVLLNLLLGLILIKLFGVIGIAFSTSISMSIGAVYFLYAFTKKIGFKFDQSLKKYVVLPIVFAIVTILPTSLFNLILPVCVNRITAGIKIVSTMLIYLGLYCLSLIAANYFDSEDIDLLKKLWLKINKILVWQ
ncbi:MAG: polysaccharide biosynthesis C-terminal domain-containing protein [Bacteroidales bacterium]